MTESLGDAFPAEQARVRVVLEQYVEMQRIFPQHNCHFAISTIKQSLANADRASISGDVTEIMRAFAELKEIQ